MRPVCLDLAFASTASDSAGAGAGASSVLSWCGRSPRAWGGRLARAGFFSCRFASVSYAVSVEIGHSSRFLAGSRQRHLDGASSEDDIGDGGGINDTARIASSLPGSWDRDELRRVGVH